MYKYTEQATIQKVIPRLLRGPANGQITARRPADTRVFRFFGARLLRQTDLDDLRLIHRRKRTFGHAGARK